MKNKEGNQEVSGKWQIFEKCWTIADLGTWVLKVLASHGVIEEMNRIGYMLDSTVA